MPPSLNRVKGVRVYARTAMGMPGSKTALEELRCHLLGKLIEAGKVINSADDLFCGGNTPDALLSNWREELAALYHSDLRHSAHKTTVAPYSTTVQRWIWCDGTLQASPHRISTLTQCDPPSTITGIGSFIGACSSSQTLLHLFVCSRRSSR